MPLKYNILHDVHLLRSYANVYATYDIIPIGDVERITVHTLMTVIMLPILTMMMKPQPNYINWVCYLAKSIKNNTQKKPYNNTNKMKKPAGFEDSSDLHMYYAFDNHIYSFSSMVIYIFLTLMTNFFSLIYASSFWNYIYMCIHVY